MNGNALFAQLEPGDVQETRVGAIVRRIRHAVADGTLLPGQRVPSIRTLAAELQLARGTVEAAYEQLCGEGILLARGQAGTVVAPDISRLVQAGFQSRAPETPMPSRPENPAPLDLQPGLPAFDAFPRVTWQRLAKEALVRQTPYEMGYPDPVGDMALRRAIAGYLTVARGLHCTGQQVIVTAGYRASLDLVADVLLAPGDSVWLEDPGYPPVAQVLGRRGARLVPLPVDAAGVCVEEGVKRAPQAALAVVTPTQQSPWGMPLSLPRQLALLDWAREGGHWVLEDDYEGEFRHRGQPLPALASLDSAGRVLYAGTFSKVLYPGLRLSYLVVPASLAGAFAMAARHHAQHCPLLWQRTVARFIDEGHFARHVKRMRSLYRERRQRLEVALQAAFGSRLTLHHQPGGMHLIAEVAGMDASAVSAQARLAGLGVPALCDWAREARCPPALMLGFANVVDDATATRQAERLLRVVDALR